MPAEVLTVKVRAVTQARAARRRRGIRRPGGPEPYDRGRWGCGCVPRTCKGPPAPWQPPVSGCTHAITLRRGVWGRALEETDRGFPVSSGPVRSGPVGAVTQITSEKPRYGNYRGPSPRLAMCPTETGRLSPDRITAH
ncbi:forkhead-associated (FHA) phosphopeptide binding domain 1 isoform 1-like protein [Streptomyces azureus]|uniref:Forkhead-associated (FHA) phosphopeptide binding domain 1 isoform 1-like protein n=1 Tax=Streptomyces azureus TaxID=146537 RepID=A0A0K8PSC2_STRAJ|nr:forkhead-associated (FHA) phosphopeptide binding domain 1 isoform 1-like protein [Streptomyces azureus]